MFHLKFECGRSPHSGRAVAGVLTEGSKRLSLAANNSNIREVAAALLEQSRVVSALGRRSRREEQARLCASLIAPCHMGSLSSPTPNIHPPVR